VKDDGINYDDHDDHDDKQEQAGSHEPPPSRRLPGGRTVMTAASAYVRLVGQPVYPAGAPLTGESPIEALDLKPRTLNCLTRASLRRVSDVASLTDGQLLALRHCSRGCLADLREHLRGFPG
jgi:hypothetical protein